jgi:putative transposase
MPRGKRYIVPGHTYHVTHRCHDREFLLKFNRDRTTYRDMLRERLPRFGISLFNYEVTSNHVHLLLRPSSADALESLSGLMQSLQGDFAQLYNRRKKRQNAFWGDRYHATMIESGEHLWRCLVYIDLNMVRAGVVDHPRDWRWTGYAELMGMRQRYRILDMPRLLRHVGATSEESFRENYGRAIDAALGRRDLARDPIWTESLAVGSQAFATRVGGGIRNRMSVDIQATDADPTVWIAKETPAAYGRFPHPKIESKVVEPLYRSS